MTWLFCVLKMEIGTEISQKIKTAIKSKLVEFGSYVDDELPDYIMVMVANKRSQLQMIEDLHLFLGDNSKMFCDWLHDLLNKLQEVTEGAFEVKVPIKTKPDDVKNDDVKTKNNDFLKISKISKKPSPIRIPNTSENPPEESGEEQNKDSRTENGWNDSKSTDSLKKATNKKEKTPEKYDEKELKSTGIIQSVVTMQKRPSLPLSKQANPTLLKKAMKAAQVSGNNQGEYNPELPASTDVQNINHESKRRQRELLFEEHKKLQRMKSQQEEDEESREPMIELQVEQDDDLFATEENVVKDQRIVVDRNAEPDAGLEVVKKDKPRSQGKKAKKQEKRKLDEDTSNDAEDQNQSGQSSEEDAKLREKQRSVKAKDKRRKPKFIVTLEGVGHKFEEKYEKEHLRKKKRRRASHKEESILNENFPTVPVCPPLIQGVHQVPGIHLPVPASNPVQLPPVQMIPATMIAQLPVDPARHSVTESLENEDEEMPLVDEEKCHFWPQCKNGNDCPYYHPDINCKHFPNCRYGKDCGYLHPQCKFGPKCTLSSCSYSHLPTTTAVSSEISALPVCRYHPFCTKQDCPFLHPSEKPCRYGNKCTRPGCTFSHSAPPRREQLKWVAPKEHVSDRQFAVNEVSTTPLPVQ